MKRVRRAAVEWATALAILVLGLIGWELAVNAFGIQKFLLPKPSEILAAFWDQRDVLWPAGWYTFTEAFWGFVIGVSFGIGAALVLARFRAVGSALMPYFIAASAIPIIAFAPIANAWFGIEKSSKIFIASLLCFFPVLVNTLRGLTSVKPQQVELMRSYAARDFTVFRRVRVPTSLPYVFASLKVASVLAMIGAIVGEYFGGSQQQLGIQIKNSAALFQFETAWAAILVACILGIGFYLAVSLAEIVTMRRYPSAQSARR